MVRQHKGPDGTKGFCQRESNTVVHPKESAEKTTAAEKTTVPDKELSLPVPNAGVVIVQVTGGSTEGFRVSFSAASLPAIFGKGRNAVVEARDVVGNGPISLYVHGALEEIEPEEVSEGTDKEDSGSSLADSDSLEVLQRSDGHLATKEQDVWLETVEWLSSSYESYFQWWLGGKENSPRNPFIRRLYQEEANY